MSAPAKRAHETSQPTRKHRVQRAHEPAPPARDTVPADVAGELWATMDLAGCAS